MPRTITAVAEPPEEPIPLKRGRRILKRVGLTLLVVVLVLVTAAVLLYNFGSMETPSPQMRARYQALVASGRVQPVAAAGFHIPIPGCTCHSNDPVQTIAHEGYTIRQCTACHSRVGPRS